MKIHDSSSLPSCQVVGRGLFLILLLALLLASCAGADPRPSDVKGVKQHFLMLRFNAVFYPELRQRSDRELIELSCQAKRVNCSKLLELAAESDPEFHGRIIQKEGNGALKKKDI